MNRDRQLHRTSYWQENASQPFWFEAAAEAFPTNAVPGETAFEAVMEQLYKPFAPTLVDVVQAITLVPSEPVVPALRPATVSTVSVRPALEVVYTVMLGVQEVVPGTIVLCVLPTLVVFAGLVRVQ